MAFQEPSHAISNLEEPLINSTPSSYAPSAAAEPPVRERRRRRPSTVVLLLMAGLLGLALFAVATLVNKPNDDGIMVSTAPPENMIPTERGVAEGVSSKSFRRPLLGAPAANSWSNRLLAWQRTAFHFQPKQNWMNG